MTGFYLHYSLRDTATIEEKIFFDKFAECFQVALENAEDAISLDLSETISDIISEMCMCGKYPFNTMKSVLLNSCVRISSAITIAMCTDNITIAMCYQMLSDKQRNFFKL